MLSRLLYIAACLIVPFVWGLLSFAVTRAVEKRRPPKPRSAQSDGKKEIPELEYYL
jgi:hypothetical protein